jgi:DNA-binding transcriptional LysR family regulator
MTASLPSTMLNNTNILSLRCFVAVVETQSFSAAARQLRLVPSSVTKHVRLIETAVEVALLHRTTRRVSVTDAGERFYQQCLTILAQVDEAALGMVAERQLSGHLRVTAPPSFAAAVLAPRIHEFLATYPELSLDLAVSSATPDLMRNRVDVAITLYEEPQSKLMHFRLGHVPLLFCASPDYLARRGTPVQPQDLGRHDCLSSRFSDLAEGWMIGRDGAWCRMDLRFKLLSDNGDVLRRACLAGAGIGNFYRFHVQDDIRSGRLVPVLRDYEAKPQSLFAIIPHRDIVRPQAKAFIAFARGLAAELDPTMG